MSYRAASETYDEAARPADDRDQGMAVMARCALLVPWYTVCYSSMLSTMRATVDENSHERA